jgi:diaminopimelate epimerase
MTTPAETCPLPFEKWQALGNDYLIVELEQLPFELTAARVRKLCAGHFGVFADGILLLARTEDPALVADLRIFNPDGSEAELSGNGAREAILYLRRRGWTQENVFSIHTVAGTITPTVTGPDTCRVDMGHAALRSRDYPAGAADGNGDLQSAAHTWHFQHVSIGNPQCAIHVEDLATLQALDLPAIGPGIESHELFPNRTNVSWYTEIDADAPDSTEIDANPTDSAEIDADPTHSVEIDANPTHSTPRARIRARIFERGAGETLSSGTGATGAAVAYHLRGGFPAGQSILVVLDGGELEVEVGEDLHINLTGWARPVFAGHLSEDFLKELYETE